MFKTMMRGALLPVIVAVVSLIAILAGGPSTAKLEADPDSALPVPQHITSTLANYVPSYSEAAYRRQLDATIPADLRSVLAFYRSELGKLGWKESAGHMVVKTNSAQLAFATPDGSAVLKLGRNKGLTTVDLAQKMPAAAAAADMLPNPGQSMLLLSNSSEAEVKLTVNGRTIKLSPGEGSWRDGSPTLELPPGNYQYTLEVSGITRNDTIELTADDAWGLTISPKGEVKSLQLY